MQSTRLKYMDHQYLYKDTARVLDIRPHESGKVCICLDQTIFYPQGGGQPFDLGRIQGVNGTFAVDEVRFADGIVHHFGQMEGDIVPDENVFLHVDTDRRRLNARAHSAGHLIDEAVHNLGYKWLATKGCHFPGQCWVEYEGLLEPHVDYAALIEAECKRMIETGYQTKAVFAETEQLDALCSFVPADMPRDKPSRVAFIWGDKGVPCGGTHVRDITDIGELVIRKVKGKKGAIKVSYELI